MLPERHSPEDYREWLNRARSSLLHAQSQRPGVYLEELCYDAQQAAEKALKAVCIQRGIRFPYTHNLGRLLELLQQDGVGIPSDVIQAIALSGYAVETRYPGLSEPVTQEDYQNAVSMAQAVLTWVLSVFESSAR
ncbi:MAG: HEPN domain-containing protein [Anaerolineales bacterium]|nr:HEPN domain-containing protein [Anaerolineales bacterium]